MTTFLQVPSDRALPESQAKTSAKKRWPCFENGKWGGDCRGDADGIEWQGSHGAREQRTWNQLNAIAKATSAEPQQPSWAANYQGRVLGYFATAEEAQSAVDAAITEDEGESA